MAEPCLKTGVRLWIPEQWSYLKISLKYSDEYMNVFTITSYQTCCMCFYVSRPFSCFGSSLWLQRVTRWNVLISWCPRLWKICLNSSEYWDYFLICEHKDFPHEIWEWKIDWNSIFPEKICFQRNYIPIKTVKYWFVGHIIFFSDFLILFLKSIIIHLVVTAASWGPKNVNYIYHKRKAKVCGCVQADMVSWRNSSVPHGQNFSVLCPEFCLDWDVAVEEKCELAGHIRNKNKSDP